MTMGGHTDKSSCALILIRGHLKQYLRRTNRHLFLLYFKHSTECAVSPDTPFAGLHAGDGAVNNAEPPQPLLHKTALTTDWKGL